MYNHIKSKLQSQSGVSILFALLAFMVAAMVSVTVVSAAISANKSVYSDEAAQQTQLAVESAAKWIRDEIVDGKTTLSETTETITDSTGAVISTSTLPGGDAGSFKELLRAAADDSSKRSDDFTISVKNAAGNDTDQQVSVHFEMDSYYNLTFKITENSQTILLTLAADADHTSTSGSYASENYSDTSDVNKEITTKATTTITWINPEIRSE